ncbi:MAG: flavin reductase [Phycisphaerales bacterium]|nr:MAG: flavin reductase [Phycisphaerales bacterium]
MDPIQQHEIAHGLSLLPAGCFLMTSAFEDERRGVLVHSVQACGTEPQLVAVAVRKGHAIEPVLRDARAFALHAVDPGEKLLIRKFSEHLVPDTDLDTDPFDAFPVGTIATGSPVLRRPGLVFDCELARHFDLESDFEIYVGLIRAVRLPPKPKPTANADAQAG